MSRRTRLGVTGGERASPVYPEDGGQPLHDDCGGWAACPSVEEYDGVLVTLIADVAERYVEYRIASKQVADLR